MPEADIQALVSANQTLNVDIFLIRQYLCFPNSMSGEVKIQGHGTIFYKFIFSLNGGSYPLSPSPQNCWS